MQYLVFSLISILPTQSKILHTNSHSTKPGVFLRSIMAGADITIFECNRSCWCRSHHCFKVLAVPASSSTSTCWEATNVQTRNSQSQIKHILDGPTVMDPLHRPSYEVLPSIYLQLKNFEPNASYRRSALEQASVGYLIGSKRHRILHRPNSSSQQSVPELVATRHPRAPSPLASILLADDGERNEDAKKGLSLPFKKQIRRVFSDLKLRISPNQLLPAINRRQKRNFQKGPSGNDLAAKKDTLHNGMKIDEFNAYRCGERHNSPSWNPSSTKATSFPMPRTSDVISEMSVPSFNEPFASCAGNGSLSTTHSLRSCPNDALTQFDHSSLQAEKGVHIQPTVWSDTSHRGRSDSFVTEHSLPQYLLQHPEAFSPLVSPRSKSPVSTPEGQSYRFSFELNSFECSLYEALLEERYRASRAPHEKIYELPDQCDDEASLDDYNEVAFL